MRKLASIQKIREILPIEGADRIELAMINDWPVVVAKEVGHKVNDKIVYCEIDSFLPIEPEFEFLRKSSYKKMDDLEGFRLKTIKLRNQYSQGLVLPLSGAQDVVTRRGNNIDLSILNIDIDVTELLCIIKYEKPIPANMTGVMKGNFPSFISKTDETRIQGLTREYTSYKNHDGKYYATEKLEGSSITQYFNVDEFGVCSRNIDLQKPDNIEENTFWKVTEQLDIENKIKDLGLNIALQGELIGEGIQGNIYKLKGQTIRYYNVFDIDKREYYDLTKFKSFINDLGLQTVPILDEDFVLPDNIQELVQLADGQSQLHNCLREGLVIRSHDRTISFKSISNNYLNNEK